MPSLILSHLLLVWLALQRLALCGERASTRERFKVVIAPLICKRTCLKGQCQDTCEQGNNTTLIGENGQSADTLTGPGFRVVVCPLTCMNGGVCSTRTHCLCPPGFTGRLCQFPLRTQASRGNKQPFYTLQVMPESQSLSEPGGTGGRQQMTHTHSVFTLQGAGHHSSEVQVNVRVVHTPDTSVVIHPHDQSENKPHSAKTVTRLPPQTHKPKGRCFQETTPKQACSSNPLPGLTNQEDCCGSVGNSWGQNKCYKCPSLPYAGKHQTIVEDFGSTCPQGYKRLNSTHCQDINECMMQGLCQNGECLNTQGSFRCTCKPGYVLAERTRCVASTATVEQGLCYRMVTEAGKCEHALPKRLSQEICCCTVGKAWGSNCERCPQDGTASFNKICPAGKGMSFLTYHGTLSIHPFLTSIEHINPDTEVKPPEVPVQTTTPMPLSPISTHAPRHPVIVARPTTPPIVHVPPESDSHELAQTQISPMDDCKLNRNICGHGECVNTQNGYVCHCYPGYQPHAQGKSCVDENECDLEPCGRGTCFNTVGSYRCNCHPGYKLVVHHGKRRCIDINECSKPDICGVGGHCTNLPGSYKCECLPGFRSKSRRQPLCEDIYECSDPSVCPNEQCENTVGSYECIPCQPGYQAQGGVCYDVNECQKRGVCLNGRCENLIGSYRCLCNEGFLPEADSKGCRDINECQDNRLCANGHCVNTEGSFRCQCYPGYQPTQEGSHCEDINECERASNCQRGRCINTMGSYRCECQKGYALFSGRRCQDIDECAEERSLCQPHGVCENRQGGYVCVCNDGYRLSEDKHSCEEIEIVGDKKECYLNLDDTVFCDSVLATNVTKQECCCSIGVGWGDHCEIYPCPVYHSVEYLSLCPVGRGFYHDEGPIEYGLSMRRDIDECVLFSNEICKEGRCMNTQPGFECYCQQGFYYDSNLLECIDVDECHDESLCTNGHCLNTRGSFYCTCNPPWVPDALQKKCVFPTVIGVDECQDPANCKNGHCVNTQDSYYCICTPPWILATDRNSCVTPEEQAVTGVSVVHLSDVNECEDPSYCRNGRCVNTPGSFHCICKQPHTFSAALKQCVYDDRTAAHKDICFEEVDEDHMCTMPQNDLTVTYSECCCHYGRGWGPECRTCPNRNSVLFNRLCEMHLETESDGEGDFLATFSSYNPERDSSEEDSDECSCANGRCVRSYLGTMCDCNTGFILDHSRTRCIDIDECAGRGTGQSPCKNARCINTFGSFKCHCKVGFVAARRPNVCIRARAQ
ncbi:latent-transforming growth factor beta-binding protein 3-like isoform X2 [Cyprinus carpio]|uniref:Latent transforming growth factor beta binding protein 3 n=1 Tax=Cyprinus carpio TaxID=7962 RepID=A0A8C2HYZ8_CYPCA|nr:latent-transforming growth factor beta-binding protein 3-like isoform X2 [Cyprinus carpio]